MRHFYLLVIFLLAHGLHGISQSGSVQPVKWTFTASKADDAKVKIRMNGVIADDWKLFSTKASDDEPNTRVIPDTTDKFTVISISEEGNLKQEKEPLFDNLLVRYFQKEVLVEVILVVPQGQNEVAGSIDYMALKGDVVIGPLPVPFRFVIQADGTIAQATTALK